MPRCPVCRTRIERIRYEGVPVYNCGSCGGHWVEKPRLDLILARREVQMPQPVQQKMVEIADASNTTRRLLCLTCGKEMIKEQFKHWAEIQLDRCPKCNGIWLDRGELEKCQIYWEYMQDHPDEWQNADLAARQALLDAEWANRKAAYREMAEQARDCRGYGYGTGGMLGGIFG